MLFDSVKRKAIIVIFTIMGLMATGQMTLASNQDDLVSNLDQKVKSLMGQYDVPGSAIGIVRKGELVWSQSYGLGNKEQGTPVTDETVFQLASVSKSLTAWGVMKLVEQGEIELDAPVGKYLTRSNH